MQNLFSLSKNIAGKYKANTRGQFAMWTAIAALPVILATGFVVDYQGAEADKHSVKRALDVAVLAAVSDNSVDTFGKEAIAREVFNVHYNGSVKLNLNVEVNDGRVRMKAKGFKEATVVRAAGMKGIGIKEASTAVMNRQNTICVMALANEGENKLRFLDSTQFDSPTCSVQSNSKDPQGVLSASQFAPIAKSFCSAGGANGDFVPAIRGECSVIEDPFETLNVPDSGVCMPPETFNIVYEVGETTLATTNSRSRKKLSANLIATNHFPENEIEIKDKGKHSHEHCHPLKPGEITSSKCHVGTHKVETIHGTEFTSRLTGLGVATADVNRLVEDYGVDQLTVQESPNYTGDNSVFYPGTYCGGLTVDGENVTFMPGVYIIKDGPLTFKNGASASAQEVSFILKGLETVLTVETGSYVNIKAPKDGPMAGLAVYQDKDGDTPPPKAGRPASRMMMSALRDAPAPSEGGDNMPTAVNLLSSGGELNVTGTLYFPTQALDVLGDSVLGARAPATSFIAHQVTFAGKTKAAVAVDHIKGNIPVMLPLSDDGARLIE